MICILVDWALAEADLCWKAHRLKQQQKVQCYLFNHLLSTVWNAN